MFVAAATGVFAWSGFFGRSYLIVTVFWLVVSGGAGLVANRFVNARPSLLAGSVVLVALAFGAVTWQIATDPQSQMFGAMVTHGSRNERLVALTFDDGPNYETTLAVRDTLDAFGVKGTFFEVASAAREAPEISRALIDDGHLVANHAETHNSLGWLSPIYSQAAAAQRTFHRDVGVCPHYFRPPHGYHTPLMARAVANAHLRLVQWDVSAHDWDTTDADLVATRVLTSVRPGSIILLHDGLDGDLVTDRSVVVRALPKIITGLRDLGLQPVRLDQLLHDHAYLTTCS